MPEAPTFDLQSHSRHSDGALPAAEVAAAAAEAGVKLLALTDHDSVEGVDEALQAARRHNIMVVPAAEITAVHGRYADLHVLGYGLNHTDATLLERLAGYRADREQRAERMAQALEALGYALDRRILEGRIQQGKTIGRPHLAQSVVGHPANAERLAAEGLAEPTAFLVAYLIEGKPAFRTRTHPTVPEAIATIHDAGGIAVWAHPFWDVAADTVVTGMLDGFAAAGVDGVEAFYLTHTAEQTQLLVRRAAELGLLTTGSSDFHGPEHRQFNRFRAFSTFGHEPVLGPLAGMR